MNNKWFFVILFAFFGQFTEAIAGKCCKNGGGEASLGKIACKAAPLRYWIDSGNCPSESSSGGPTAVGVGCFRSDNREEAERKCTQYRNSGQYDECKIGECGNLGANWVILDKIGMTCNVCAKRKEIRDNTKEDAKAACNRAVQQGWGQCAIFDGSNCQKELTALGVGIIAGPVAAGIVIANNAPWQKFQHIESDGRLTRDMTACVRGKGQGNSGSNANQGQVDCKALAQQIEKLKAQGNDAQNNNSNPRVNAFGSGFGRPGSNGFTPAGPSNSQMLQALVASYNANCKGQAGGSLGVNVSANPNVGGGKPPKGNPGGGQNNTDNSMTEAKKVKVLVAQIKQNLKSLRRDNRAAYQRLVQELKGGGGKFENKPQVSGKAGRLGLQSVQGIKENLQEQAVGVSLEAQEIKVDLKQLEVLSPEMHENFIGSL